MANSMFMGTEILERKRDMKMLERRSLGAAPDFTLIINILFVPSATGKENGYLKCQPDHGC
jgi:hypothetical protein